jgi:hypothetical protein
MALNFPGTCAYVHLGDSDAGFKNLFYKFLYATDVVSLLTVGLSTGRTKTAGMSNWG